MKWIDFFFRYICHDKRSEGNRIRVGLAGKKNVKRKKIARKTTRFQTCGPRMPYAANKLIAKQKTCLYCHSYYPYRMLPFPWPSAIPFPIPIFVSIFLPIPSTFTLLSWFDKTLCFFSFCVKADNELYCLTLTGEKRKKLKLWVGVDINDLMGSRAPTDKYLRTWPKLWKCDWD